MPILPVIDLHSHAVPGVDDGARSFEEAGAILRGMDASYPENSTLVFTPHYSVAMPEKVAAGRSRRVSSFLESVSEQYNLEFAAGGELLMRGPSLANMEHARYPGTGWVLVEFPLRISWIETILYLRRVIKKGYSPLIAHPERYAWCRRKPGRLILLSRMGCGSLVSARSLRSQKYASAARRLLADGLAHGLASDAHSPADYILDTRLRALIEDSSSIPWDLMTFKIPQMILEDEKLPELPLQRRITL